MDGRVDHARGACSRHGRCGTCTSDRVRGACFRVLLRTCANEGRCVSPRLLRDLPGWRHRLTGGEGDLIAKQITDVLLRLRNKLRRSTRHPRLLRPSPLLTSCKRLVKLSSRLHKKPRRIAPSRRGKSFPEEMLGIPRPLPWKKSLEAVNVLLRDVLEEFLDSLPCHR